MTARKQKILSRILWLTIFSIHVLFSFFFRLSMLSNVISLDSVNCVERKKKDLISKKKLHLYPRGTVISWSICVNRNVAGSIVKFSFVLQRIVSIIVKYVKETHFENSSYICISLPEFRWEIEAIVHDDVGQEFTLRKH